MSKILMKMQFTTTVRKSFYQSLADYLEQGIPINDIIKLLADSIRLANAKSQMFQAKILDNIRDEMSAGVDFADAVAVWIPMNEAMSIQAGFKSGDPGSGMRNTLEALESASAMKSTIISKLSYPGVLLLALVGLIFFFSIAIIPKIVTVMDPAKWPDSAKPLYTVSQFVQNEWYIVVAVIVSAIFATSWSMPKVVGSLRGFLDIFPPFSFYKAFHGANLLISLASLMKSGIPLVDSLHEMKKLSTPYIRWHLNKMIGNMEEGASLGEALDTGLLSPEMMVNVHMMSRNANFQTAIYAIGRQAVVRSVETISTISGLLNGVALLGVTGYVGWVYFSFFTISNSMAAQV